MSNVFLEGAFKARHVKGFIRQVYPWAVFCLDRVARVTFLVAITTEESSCIFMRNSPYRANELHDGMTINGGGVCSGQSIVLLTAAPISTNGDSTTMNTVIQAPV